MESGRPAASRYFAEWEGEGEKGGKKSPRAVGWDHGQGSRGRQASQRMIGGGDQGWMDEEKETDAEERREEEKGMKMERERKREREKEREEEKGKKGNGRHGSGWRRRLDRGEDEGKFEVEDL